MHFYSSLKGQNKKDATLLGAVTDESNHLSGKHRAAAQQWQSDIYRLLPRLPAEEHRNQNIQNQRSIHVSFKSKNNNSKTMNQGSIHLSTGVPHI